jgi:hypothetical protein
MAKVTITLNVPSNSVSGKDIANAARRIFAKVETLDETGEVQGATYKVKPTVQVTGPAAVREWARKNKVEVGLRGRISAELQAAYDAANA